MEMMTSDQMDKFFRSKLDVEKELSEAKKEIAKLKEAIKIYANRDYWEYDEIDYWEYDGITGGKLARKVLSDLDK